jgi:tRNA threonylcarbamoyladenosine biosynthesis protein TsaB
MILPYNSSSVCPYLAIDTALGTCSVAIGCDNQIMAYAADERGSSQSQTLLPMVESCLRHAGIRYQDLGGVITTVGPGGFTGIRIGLAAAHGIAVGLGIPLLGYSTLACLACEAWERTGTTLRVVTAIQALKGQCYTQCFEYGTMNHQNRAKAMTYQERAQSLPDGSFLLAGNVNATLKPLLPAERGKEIRTIDLAAVDARSLLHLARAPYRSLFTALPALPLYISPPDAKKPRNFLDTLLQQQALAG